MSWSDLPPPPKSAEKSPLKATSAATGIFVDRLRLMKNQSTQNISIEARTRIIEDVAPMIYRELQRRGLHESVDPETGQVTEP